MREIWKLLRVGLLISVLVLINVVKVYGEVMEKVQIIGHRGASAIEPENTIPSFEMAAKVGMWGVEADLFTLKDGSLVIFHDEEVDRMTNGVGNIQNMTLEEVKSLDVDNGNNIEKYKNLKIPTLDEYLKCCSKNNLVPVIEFKGVKVESVKDVVDRIKSYGLEDRSIIISTSCDWIKYIREYSSKIHFQYLSDITLENINLLKPYGNYGIDIKSDKISLHKVELAHLNGAKVNVWTINTKEEIKALVEMGVDMITSDSIK